ncbi:hypothetical protein RRG08_047465 [Elysia crispata]|uniref:Uncharacterized protein n=1 Tax=Elysia crispata TaxID=231223 RepID=A0AAE1CZY8_9GAST|nr:hypothetical protein RRG08_047465 [Elysia crispata]
MDFPCGSLCQYCVYKCPVLDPRNPPSFSRFRFLTFWVFFYAVVKSDNSWNCRLLGSALKHKLCPEQIILVEYHVWDFLRKVPKDHLHQTSYQPS